MIETIGSPLLWAGFIGLVLVFLALDLGVFHRKAHAVSSKEALVWTIIWISLSLLFNAWIYFRFGHQAGLQYLTGYLIEKALSIDNIFVFLVLFQYFAVPAKYQHRVLFWGILGALVMRGIFIALGATLISQFHWVLYIFGAFLVYTGAKLLKKRDVAPHPENNRLVKWLRGHLPITADYHGQHFFVREAGKRMVTPLLLVLIVVEATDLVFALDSIPAIFAVTTDPFLVFTSNNFAILGLRALYFLLADWMDRFHYLKHGLGLVLIFVGAKMLVEHWVEIPIEASLVVVAGLIGGSIALSWWRFRHDEEVG
jgi:tellurite resistance protein TerC